MDELITWAKTVGVPTLMLVAAIVVIARLMLGNILSTIKSENEANREAVNTAVEDSQKRFTDALAAARKEYLESLRTMREDYIASLEAHTDAAKKTAEEHARTITRFITTHENAQRELLNMIASLKGVRRTADPTPSRPRTLRPPGPATPPPET